MVLFPWGSPAMGFLPGEGLPYGIPSGGTFGIYPVQDYLPIPIFNSQL